MQASYHSEWNMSWVNTLLSSSSLHIWSRNHLAKQTWLTWKAYFISKRVWGFSNLDDIYLLDFKRNVVGFFSSKDPPSKENPYEDIELERSCLGSKCVSPSSSSPVPGTPTKVAALTLQKTNKVLYQYHLLNACFAPPVLLKAWLLQADFRTEKLQAPGTAQNQGRWHLLLFPHQPPLYTQQPRRHPLPLWRPVQSQTEENPQGKGVSESFEKAPAAVIYGPVYRSGRLGAGLLALLSGDEHSRGKFSDGYFLWEVCLDDGLPEAIYWKKEPGRFVY